MKTKLLFFALFISVSAFGQIEIEEGYPLLEPHGNDSLCKIRGHVLGGLATTTLMYCPDRVEDYEDYSVHIYGDCNTTTRVCQRCGKIIKTKGTQRNDTTWYKKPTAGRIPKGLLSELSDTAKLVNPDSIKSKLGYTLYEMGRLGIGSAPITQLHIWGGSLVAHDLRIIDADTIPIMMLVCDTLDYFRAFWIRDSIGAEKNRLHPVWNSDRYKIPEKKTGVWWQYGYKIASGATIWDNDGEIIGYLDKNKKPLPKNIVVWMSKEI